MGFFNKPLLPARYDNEDVQISAELCSNISLIIVGLAKGEITILSGNEDMIHIKTSVQAKESILTNGAALEPIQIGDHYTYTIHTPLEDKLKSAVTFQVFITIPRHLESLESFTIHGSNIELSIGNISHTFIRTLAIQNCRGDITLESFYGESAIIKSTIAGSICGKYSVARLLANAKSGKIISEVHLLNTDESQPHPKVVCSTLHHPVILSVDGTDLFGQFAVEAKTQCQPLDVKVLLASPHQRLLGNFINFGGPARIRLSGNYQGRVETRTLYGRIIIDEPEFKKLEGATLSLPSPSGCKTSGLRLSSQLNFPPSGAGTGLSSLSSSSSSSSISSLHQSVAKSSRTSSQGSVGWDRDDPRHILYSNDLNHQKHPFDQYSNVNSSSVPGSTIIPSGVNSYTNSIYESTIETKSTVTTNSEEDRKKKRDKEKESVVKELIGTIGHGAGLIMVKNRSGDIAVSLI
ncbi:hypothetical protein BX616_010542 [Lobosporangium transversale]|uniref:Adhesin domain-containing protein n=1 Tax=Lobosporangium transversale TaxID=64571 RepID=A0A1Y2GQI0_9FUNG|nr:hypothetical protein BCR41DRAFT_385758 [Lobosporangium transversale]KAF9911614.1 hypothetical protein BX616_010542 [Lobosporangium transversale]ORZ19114.1 hypothetical protein BCR41DRAFT_385758 [Lobosporangium transversale]|eukprot:XP_021882282.1 hypothetical protein BCR41DRAFT_385758 [Lobosporangium transversale]